MNDSNSSKKLNWVICLLTANLLVMTVGAVALVLGLLPKVERAVQSSQRVEARFQSFADDVQPVVSASSGKAVEAIQQIDALRLSGTANEKANALMESAAERAKRFLEGDKKKSE